MNRNCKHKNLVPYLEPQGIKLYTCADCKLILSEKIFVNEDFDEVYEDYYKKGKANRFGSILERVVYVFRYTRALKIKNLNKTYSSILDVGCGRGITLYVLRKHFGFKKAEGTQLEKNAYEYASKTLKLKIYDKDLPEIDFKGTTFDVITYWHVLEHLKDPHQHLELFNKLLTKNGTIIIEVPNIESWTTKLTGKYCLGLDPKHHLFFFSKALLEEMFAEYGLSTKFKSSFSFEYSTFTSVQSLINWITKSDNLLFDWMQKRRAFSYLLLVHLFLMVMLLIPCFLINIALFKSNMGEVLHVHAYKDPSYKDQ